MSMGKAECAPHLDSGPDLLLTHFILDVCKQGNFIKICLFIQYLCAKPYV